MRMNDVRRPSFVLARRLLRALVFLGRSLNRRLYPFLAPSSANARFDRELATHKGSARKHGHILALALAGHYPIHFDGDLEGRTGCS